MKPSLTTWLFLFFCAAVSAQQTDVVNFKRIEAKVEPKKASEGISGILTVEFEILKPADSVYLDAVEMKVSKVTSKGIKAEATSDKIWLTGTFEANKLYNLTFSYQATPKQTLYFTGEQIWTQGQGKYTSHWLPSLDDMKDKIEFDLSIIVSPGQTVIANGELQEIETLEGKQWWSFDMKNPMASYLVAFVVGDFKKMKLKSNSGIPIELYFKPEDSLKAEPTYRYTKQIFDFFENEIGVPYVWQNYKQIPVRDFLYAGMENTTATIFSEAFVVDSTGFNDRNYVNVNAHEMAHQWFGDLVTETSGTHHWLQEGFATYFALLAEKEIFGADYFYWKLYNSAEQLKELSDQGKGETILNPKASSLTFYEKGAWALHILKELIGETTFKTAVKNYLQKHAFKNVETEDFLKEVKAVTAVDISQWEADWLQQSAFQADQAFQSLMKSNFMTEFFQISALRGTPLKDKLVPLKTALTFPNDFIGQEAVYQLSGETSQNAIQLLEQAFMSNNLFVRQAIALSVDEIPLALQQEYESLLNDESYVTQEAMLYNLWLNFPKIRNEYLDKMKGVEGFQDKNIRQLWLVLSLLTEGYNDSEKPNYLSELKSYTSSNFSFEIRRNALQYIFELQLWDAPTLKDLINASVHHSWQFRNSAREMLKEVMKNSGFKNTVISLKPELSEKEKNYLNSIL